MNIRTMNALNMLFAGAGSSPTAIQSAFSNVHPPTLGGAIPRRAFISGTAKCECGKTISGNKRFCFACAEIKARQAGLFK